MGWRLRGQWLALASVAAVLVIFLGAPLLSLVLTLTPNQFVQGLEHPFVGPALRLSLITTTCSLAITLIFGTPLAWCLAQSKTKGSTLLEIAIQLPIVIPPSVAGIALLLAYGRRGFLTPDDTSLAFTTAAVVVAELFVSAPFFVQTACAAFRRIDPNVIAVARSFGAMPWRVFLRVAVPLAAPGLFAGAALCWARALGEFGATLMFAGNLSGRTQTLPLAIYTTLESDLQAAQALAFGLVVVALVLLIVARWAVHRLQAHTGAQA